jgi:hypothetical protein
VAQRKERGEGCAIGKFWEEDISKAGAGDFWRPRRHHCDGGQQGCAYRHHSARREQPNVLGPPASQVVLRQQAAWVIFARRYRPIAAKGSSRKARYRMRIKEAVQGTAAIGNGQWPISRSERRTPWSRQFLGRRHIISPCWRYLATSETSLPRLAAGVRVQTPLGRSLVTEHPRSYGLTGGAWATCGVSAGEGHTFQV